MKKLLIVPVLGLMLLNGCSYEKGTAEIEQERTEQNQAELIQSQPPVKLSWSLERENINKRTTLWNDENKVSYVYLISYGKVMAFYTIKGKISSVNSQITNPEQLAIARIGRGAGTYADVEGVLPSPAEDGSYGSNGDAIYFFTTEGAYIEWAGEYMLADQPLKLTTQPELVRAIK